MLITMNRDDRKKIYKHRKSKGLLNQGVVKDCWTWNKWNAWFIKQNSSLQNFLYQEMLEDKGEDNMLKAGTVSTIYHAQDLFSQLDCCAQDACPPCKTTTAVQSPCTPYAWRVPEKKQEEEHKMSYNQIDVRVAPAITGESEIATQRKFLQSLLTDIFYEKCSQDFRRAFGLVDDEAPRTIKERKARMAAGLYTIDFDFDEEDFEEDEDLYGLGRGHIRWRDPSKKEDNEGFKAATLAMNTELEKVKRIIAIKDADTGLAAVEAFEAKSFIPATVH